jgi:hypothetical protein
VPRDKQEQPDVPPFEYRAGVTMPPIGGMYRRGDPSQIPPHRLHLGVNIRLADNDAGDRPGLVQVTGNAEGACITGIFEIEDLAVAIYITQLADGGLVSGTPQISDHRILAFNEERDPVSRNYWDAAATFAKKAPSPWRTENAGDCFNTFQPFNDTLLIANGQDVYQAEFSEDDGLARLDLSHLFTLPAAATGNVVSTCTRRERVDDAQTGSDFDKDVLYMGCEGGQIFRYDGTTIELVHTLASGGRMQIISWRGVGLVAAGDSAAGFSYQEQPGFAWANQVWGQAFNCNGLCEFLGDIVFVGDTDGVVFAGKWAAYALHWDGSGAPVVFASDEPSSEAGIDTRYRSPVVSAGAVHWLNFNGENLEPPDNSDGFIARFEDFTIGDKEWAAIGLTGNVADEEAPGFFIPYAGAMLLFSRNAGPAAIWPEGDNIILVFSGSVVNFDPVYNWPREDGQRALQPGQGYEAIPL